MAIIQIKPKKNEEQKFTELIEENKLRFYKISYFVFGTVPFSKRNRPHFKISTFLTYT